MREVLINYLNVAEALLEKYKALGDENAIRAGEGMVAILKLEIEELGV